MNIAEIETYYGPGAARWIREKMADGTIKSLPCITQMRNPQCTRPWLTIADVINLGLVDVCPTRYPDEVRAHDVVNVTK